MQNNERSRLLQQKKEQLAKKQLEAKALAEKRRAMEAEFTEAQRFMQKIHPKQVKQFVRTTGAYILGKRNRKQLYSKTYKRKQASNELKPYKYALYNEGFIHDALADLQTMYKETNNHYVRQAIAWELALWFANKQTESGAFQAIPYVKVAKSGEKAEELVRTMTILEAECLIAIGEQEKAHALLIEQLDIRNHPDLYLALANTETDVTKKLARINQTYHLYDLAPITTENMGKAYDDLRMKDEALPVEGPKISVILPAYNAEQGIRIAIESILGQSWQNIELLIVDDCSPDQTMAVIKSYQQQDERIKVFQTPENSGPYIARNIALAEATGEFVTVNDADDWSHQDKLSIQAEHLLANANIIANTSEQARLTEDLQLYRRGNPGKYIFSNMSSLMFRREPVMEKLGYWDNVRFAADGEFVRRFVRVFGEDALAHLQTGPFSFPRQSVSSLTSSSAFGYSGFFMGVRKEYVESFTAYHDTATELYYPKEQTTRLFPVPAPMLPAYQKGTEHFDLIMMLDLHDQTEASVQLLEKELKKSQELGWKLGIVHKTRYHPDRNRISSAKQDLSKRVRQLIEMYGARMVVYGESITCQVIIIRSPEIIEDWEKFIPNIKPIACLVLIDELPEVGYNGEKATSYNFRQCMQQIMIHFDKKGRWYPLNEEVREKLVTIFSHEIRAIHLATDNWTTTELPEEQYALRLKDRIM